jgi:hypothetical protein
MTASSKSVIRSGGQIFVPEPITVAARAKRSLRFVARWFDLADMTDPFPGFACRRLVTRKVGRSY